MSWKLKFLIFVKILVQLKIGENWSVRFLCNFVKSEVSDFCEVCVRSWKLKKNKASEFCEVFVYPGDIKIGENWSFWFLWKFMYPGSWKLQKIEASDFFVILCTRGHGNWRKFQHLIFVKFCLTGVMKIEVSDFCEVLCTVMKIEEK